MVMRVFTTGLNHGSTQAQPADPPTEVAAETPAEAEAEEEGRAWGSEAHQMWEIYHLIIWLSNIDMERSTIFKNGIPSISMGHFPWLC